MLDLVFCFAPLCGQLRDDDRRYHERAADELVRAHALAEQQRAEHRGEERFKAHQQRDDRRVAALLGEYLECVAEAAGEHRDVQQRPYARRDIAERYRLHRQRKERRQHRDDEEHPAAEHEPVNARAEPVDSEDLHGEEERAQQEVQVAGGDGEAIGNAQKVHAHDRNGNGEPVPRGYPLLEKYLPDGHEHDVQRRDEPGLSGGRAHVERQLLHIGRGKQRRAADDAADDDVAPCPAVRLSAQQADGEQHQKRDERTQRRYRERAEILRADALSGESRAPYDCGEQREN